MKIRELYKIIEDSDSDIDFNEEDDDSGTDNIAVVD